MTSRLFSSVSLFACSLMVCIASMVIAIGFGAASISFSDVFQLVTSWLSSGENNNFDPIKERIILELRMPRVLLAFLAGAGLSLAGAVLQTVTRNPLSDPYLFGISSGASFGAVLVIASFGSLSILGFELGITTGAFIGSTFSVLVVLAMAGNGGQIERMLLAGVAVSFMFGAGTSIVLYMSDPLAAASLLFWTLGSFSRASWGGLALPAIIICLSLVLFLAYSRPLKAMLAGDENARALGVSVGRLRIGMLLLSSLMTATLVANCGGIGFVGLMVPHIVRRLLANKSESLYVYTALFGGVFMVWVDVLARTLSSNSELPIGVITAAIGSVFFLLVLYRRGHSG